MSSRLAALFCLVVLATGCAPKWSLRTEKSDIALQWPYQPNRAKVTYVMSLKGLELSSGSNSLWHAIVYGKEGNSQNLFNLPVAVATGKDGRIAIADMGCGCVHLYIPAEKRYMRLSKIDTERLSSPVSVIFDDELRLYVSDSQLKNVFVFGKDGTFLSPLQKDGPNALQRPTGLAYNSDRRLLYVADTLGNRVYAFHPDGEIAFSFGGRGEEAGRFNYPTHIFWSSGVLYVTDTMNFRIELFDVSGHFLGSFGHHGDGSGDLAMPKGVAADRDGVIYVVDSLFDNVQLFDRKGSFLLTLGGRGVDFGEFWLPSGIFLDGSGRLYVCDTYNRRVQIFSITGDYSDGKF